MNLSYRTVLQLLQHTTYMSAHVSTVCRSVGVCMPMAAPICHTSAVGRRREDILVPDVVTREHITPVLRQLHWLPVRQRVELKLAVLVYKAMNGLSPQYLADDCQLTSTAGWQRLGSSNVATCEVPRTRTSLGDRSFTVAGPRLWSNLPLHLRDSEHTLLEFRRLLKTHLFCWGQRCLVTVFFLSALYICIYITFTCTVYAWCILALRIRHQLTNQLSWHWWNRQFLQHVRIARNAERCNSQRDSVCLSVTFRYCVQTNEDTIMSFSASGRTILLVSKESKFIWIFAGDHPQRGRQSEALPYR